MSSGQPEAPEFLVDRSLGSVIVPQALAKLGYRVHTLESVYGKERARTLEDATWLEDAGRAGWLCLMKDRVTRRWENHQTLCRYNVKAFCATNAHLTGEQYAQLFVHNINRIVLRGRQPGPFLYAVYRHTIVRLFPEGAPLSKRQAKLRSRK